METSRYTFLSHDAVCRDHADLNVDFYLDLTGGEKSIVFGHPEDGYLFIGLRDKHGWMVRHVYVLPHRRGLGISRALLDAASAYCREQKQDFFVYLTYTDDYTREFLHRYVHERKMTPCVPTRLFVFENREFFETPEWQRNMRRMQFLTQRWESKGAITTTFDQCPEAVLENLKQLYQETDVENFQVSGDIYPFIPDRYDPLSFITYKDDEPMAFVFSKRYGSSLLFSGNLALKKYRNNGVFILPLYYFIKGGYADMTLQRMTCKIVGYNTEAVQLVENIWAHARPRIVHMQVYAHFANQEEG